jgi:branched-chain amino acid transport system permease protein
MPSARASCDAGRHRKLADMSGYVGSLLNLLCINVVFAYGIFLPVVAGQLNLGGAGFQALGGYVAAYLASTYGVPPIYTLPLATLAGAAAGFVLAFPLSRTRGVYMVLATIAFGEAVTGAILALPALGGAEGIPVPSYIGLNVILPVTIGVILLCFYLMATRLGLTLRAVHDDEAVADLMGVSVRFVQVTCYTLGGGIVGLSGGLYAHQFGFVQAQGFDDTLSVNVLLYVLLGGTQTAWGPLVGTALIVLIPEALRVVLPSAGEFLMHLFGAGGHISQPDDSWRFVLLGVFTVLMMIWRPQGVVTKAMVAGLAPVRKLRRRTA